MSEQPIEGKSYEIWTDASGKPEGPYYAKYKDEKWVLSNGDDAGTVTHFMPTPTLDKASQYKPRPKAMARPALRRFEVVLSGIMDLWQLEYALKGSIGYISAKEITDKDPSTIIQSAEFVALELAISGFDVADPVHKALDVYRLSLIGKMESE